jgi:quinol---cytochrome c reductase iron-sulfur subunit, bacillus type
MMERNDMAASNRNSLSRREFIKATLAFAGGLMGLTIGIPALAYLLSPSLRNMEDDSMINLGPLENFPIGTPTRSEFTRTKVNGWERTATSHGLYVVRMSGTQVRVFSDICTHLGCRVSWHPDQEHYISPCHNGHFDILGVVISGPPPRPLDEFVTRIDGGKLFVQLPVFKRIS